MVPLTAGVAVVLPSVTCVATNDVAQLPVAVNVTGVPEETLRPLYVQDVALLVLTLT